MRSAIFTVRTLASKLANNGVQGNKLFRPMRDGPARWDPVMMAQEHLPNKDSAEWSLLVRNHPCAALTSLLARTRPCTYIYTHNHTAQSHMQMHAYAPKCSTHTHTRTQKHTRVDTHVQDADMN